MTQTSSTTSEEAVFVLSREFEAPRDLVFKAWTEAERLAQWWGPKDFAIRVSRLDLRSGGTFLYSMRGPDGTEMWGKFVYREVSPPQRLVFVVSFTDEEGNTVRAPFSEHWPLEVLSSLTFEETGGRTTLTLRGLPIDATEAERKAFLDMFASMQDGWGGTLDKLADYLARALNR